MDRSIGYQASAYYAVARALCSNYKHKTDTALCMTCKGVVQLAEDAEQAGRLDEVTKATAKEEPAVPQSYTIALVTKAMQIAREEGELWAKDAIPTLQAVCTTLAHRIAKRIAMLKYEQIEVPSVLKVLDEKRELAMQQTEEMING